VTSKEYLKNIPVMDRLINCKLRQLEKLKEESTRTSSVISDMPRSDSPNLQRMEETIVKMLDLEAEINSDIDRLVSMKRIASEAINKLTNPDQRMVLELRYLCREKWPSIADEFGYSMDNVFRIHRAALKNIQLPESF